MFTFRCACLCALLLSGLATAQTLSENPGNQLLPSLAPAPSDPPVDYFSRDSFRIDPVICPFRDQIDYEPGEIECGLLQVPENREAADSRFIELHFIKMNSTWDEESNGEKENKEKDTGLAPGKRDDPVIYLTGGPGAPASYYVERFKDHRIRKHRDLYILEQRGIANSGDFCRYYATRKPETAQAETYEESLRDGLAAQADCANNARAAGVDIAAYNTIENARDVHALRRALGFENWNVWGISYGTILGQAYLREDPGAIRAIALDANVPINAREETLYWRTINWYDRDLKKLDAACQADADCARHYPDLGKRLRDAVRTVIDNPIVVKVKDTERYPSGQAHVFEDLAALLPFSLLYEQDNYPGLPALIYAWADLIESRDETLFSALAQAPPDLTISQGMYNAILCLDGYVDGQVSAGLADMEEFPVLGRLFGSRKFLEDSARLCRDVGMPPRGPGEYQPVSTDIPALIIEGDMDPITPPPMAKAILPGFSNGTYVEFPYAGHGPSRSVECAGDMLNKFYDDPTATPDLSCVDEMEAPDFVAPLFRTAIGPRLALRAFEDKKALIAPAAWLAISLLAVLIAFFVLSAGPVARRLDGRTGAGSNGARWMTWCAAMLGTLAAVIIGAGAAVTYDTTEMLLLFGLVPWAKFGAYAGLLAGIAGIAAIALTIRSQRDERLPVATLTGFILTGMAAVSLSAFLLAWDLGPF